MQSTSNNVTYLLRKSIEFEAAKQDLAIERIRDQRDADYLLFLRSVAEHNAEIPYRDKRRIQL